jgi:hypothetical protein
MLAASLLSVPPAATVNLTSSANLPVSAPQPPSRFDAERRVEQRRERAPKARVT